MHCMTPHVRHEAQLDIQAEVCECLQINRRAGAAKVTAVEVNEHICDVAAEVFSRNGYAHCCMAVNKDIRSVKVDSATLEADLTEKADLCVFEVIPTSVFANKRKLNTCYTTVYLLEGYTVGYAVYS